MSYVISVEELNDKLTSRKENIAIVDARFQLNDPEAGRTAYEESHLPGAVYFDLEKDLSGEKGEHGGNHPLPDIATLAKKLGEAGIDQETTVIIYDKENDMFAPRLWWLLHYMGHKQTFVLNGGIAAWMRAGYPVTDEIPGPTEKTFTPNIRPNETVDIQHIKENIASKTATLIDSRSYDRYLGKTEPLYKKAGHIPGAKNYFWADVLDVDGNWKSNKDLAQHFANLDKEKEIIVSCGSGVSATPNVIALKMAGFTNVKLYPGSYSDWISYDDNPVQSKEKQMKKNRCAWAPEDDTLYSDYHDHEWGRAVHDDQKLFEMLTLEGAQAGLSWITILRRRENYRGAFNNFDVRAIANYDEEKIQALKTNEGIIRNERKIRSVVANAKAFLEIQKEFGSFDAYIWRFVGGEPIINHWKNHDEVPAQTKESQAMSKDLKKRGFTFVGPTICYAFMQATGMVNDHTENCFLYEGK